MKKPVIDPSTLSEEQRIVIRRKYAEIKEISFIIGNNEIFAGDEVIFEWLFGKEFFQKNNDDESESILQ